MSVRLYWAGDWSVVEITGELDIQGVLSLRPLMCQRGRFVVFDLHRVTFMDCSGLGLLATVAHTASEARGCVRVVVGASRQVPKIITLTGLDRAFHLFDSLDDALA